MSGGAKPAVSVLMCAYNRRGCLEAALASVYAQTFADFEIVLVDDGSTDGTSAWLRRQAFPRMTLIRTRRSAGPAAARNLGLAAARGALVAFLDSDDLWRPGYLSTARRAFSAPGIVAALSAWSFIDAEGRALRGERRPLASGLPRAPLTSAAVVRRDALTALGGFDPAFKRLWEEQDLFCRLARRFGRAAFRYVDRPLVRFRRHAGQLHLLHDRGGPARDPAHERARREGRLDFAYFCRKHAGWLAPAQARDGAGAFEHAFSARLR